MTRRSISIAYFVLEIIGLSTMVAGIVQVGDCNFPGSYQVDPVGWCAIPNGYFMIGFAVAIISAVMLLLVTFKDATP